MNNNSVIISPILSEKSHSLSEQFNKYVFKVHKNANKLEIKKSIESRFDVKIVKVSTMHFKGKKKNMTIRSDGNVLRTTGNRSNWKKAIVTLHKDSKINFVEGEYPELIADRYTKGLKVEPGCLVANIARLK